MVIWNSLISFLIVAVLFVFVNTLPNDTSSSEFGGIAFFSIPFLILASILSLLASIVWVKRIRNGQYTRFYHYLAITPSLPTIALCIFFVIYLFRQGLV